MSDTLSASVREPTALAPRYDKPGQPTSYKPEYAEMARKHCLLGAKETDLAKLFNVVIATIHNWKQEHPAFLSAIKDGRELADAEIANSLYHKAKGHEHKVTKAFMPAGASEPVYAEYMEYYPPDTAAAIIWLKNRHPDKWRDYRSVDLKVQHEHSVSEQTQEFLSSMLAALAEDDSNTLIDASATVIEDKSTK